MNEDPADEGHGRTDEADRPVNDVGGSVTDDSRSDEVDESEDATTALPITAVDGRMKLHPLSVPYRIIQSGFGIVPLIFLAAFFVGQAQPGLFGPSLVVLLVLGMGAAIVWQIAYYRRFEYELTSDTFDIHSGVIARRSREIPYRRVQNVDISRTLVQRAMGVAELRIETAGGTSSEAHLRYVGYDEAKRLQDELRERTAGERAPETDEPTPADDRRGELLYRITGRDLGVLAVASFDLRVASFLAVILSIGAPTMIIDLVLLLPIDPVVVVVAAALVVVIASAVLSGSSAIINNYGFTLTRVGDELRYERGMLQRYDGSIPLDKVQTLVIHENLFKRWLAYASLTVETAGYGPSQQGNESAKAVPISRTETVRSIAREIEPFEDVTFTRPAPQARIRYTVQYLALATVALGASYAAFSFTTFEFAWWVIAVGLPLAPAAAHLKWVHRGVAVTDEYVLTRTGFWNRRTHVVPHYRIQTIAESQTVLQRRWRIATLVVDTAGSSGIVGGDPIAYDLAQELAAELRGRLAAELQESLAERGGPRFDDVWPGDPGTDVNESLH